MDFLQETGVEIDCETVCGKNIASTSKFQLASGVMFACSLGVESITETTSSVSLDTSSKVDRSDEAEVVKTSGIGAVMSPLITKSPDDSRSRTSEGVSCIGDAAGGGKTGSGSGKVSKAVSDASPLLDTDDVLALVPTEAKGLSVESLGAYALSRMTEGLYGNMPQAENPEAMLDGVKLAVHA